MASQNQKDWSRSKTIVFIGLVASIIAIISFFTGKGTLDEVLKSISPKPVGHENKPILKDTTFTDHNNPETQQRQATELQKPSTTSVEESNKRQSSNSLSTSRSQITTDLSEQPAMMQELAMISDANLLLTKLDQYNKRGLLAIGKKTDFENPNGYWIFIFDESRVYETFIFQDNHFLNVRTNQSFLDVPVQFRDKQQIWVVESYKLTQE